MNELNTKVEETENTVETTEEQTENTEETTTEETQASEEKKQSRSQNAKQRLRRKLHQSEAEKETLRLKNEEWETKFTALEQKVDSVLNPPAARPMREGFETEEEYEDALLDWKLEQVKPIEATPEKTETKETVDPVPELARKNWHEQIDLASEKYDDFDDVISNKDLTMTDPMAIAIMESPYGGEVAYFLGKNPTEAERISQLGVTAQVIEIDKLSNKFVPSTSNAPAPIDPPKGSDAGVKDVSKMTPDEYRIHRRAERAARGN